MLSNSAYPDPPQLSSIKLTPRYLPRGSFPYDLHHGTKSYATRSAIGEECDVVDFCWSYSQPQLQLKTKITIEGRWNAREPGSAKLAGENFACVTPVSDSLETFLLHLVRSRGYLHLEVTPEQLRYIFTIT